MKTIEIINNLIKETILEFNEKLKVQMTAKKFESMQKNRDAKIREFKKLIKYLESQPTEIFLKSQIEKLNNLLDKKGSAMDRDGKFLYPVNKWKMQLKTLNFILAD